MTRIVTTSWDDGDPRDLRLAELLSARGLTGTFYVPSVGYNGRSTLDPAGLRSLQAGRFEVGAHGVSHRTLPQFSNDALVQEVRVCKQRLEETLGSPIRSFCYPRGEYNRNIIRQVQNTGYQLARTTQMLSTDLQFDPFRMPTTLHAFPHLRVAYLRNIARSRDLRKLHAYVRFIDRASSWVDIGKMLFDRVLKHGGIWHLFGHSWELEDLGLWNDLERLLDHVCRRERVLYVSNIDTLQWMIPCGITTGDSRFTKR